MNLNQKIILSTLVVAILAFSVASAMANASTSGNLYQANTLTIVGSSTVGPIAVEESNSFGSYWASLSSSVTGGYAISTINIAQQGSGTAMPDQPLEQQILAKCQSLQQAVLPSGKILL